MPDSRTYVPHSDDEALLLIESLLHELVAVGALTIDRAVAVVEIAADARDQVRQARDPQEAADAIALEPILATLRNEQEAMRQLAK